MSGRRNCVYFFIYPFGPVPLFFLIYQLCSFIYGHDLHELVELDQYYFVFEKIAILFLGADPLGLNF
jgi:hypothetical protein